MKHIATSYVASFVNTLSNTPFYKEQKNNSATVLSMLT